MLLRTLITLIALAATTVDAQEIRFSEVVYGADLIVVGELNMFRRDTFMLTRSSKTSNLKMEQYFATALMTVNEVIKGPSGTTTLPVAALSRVVFHKDSVTTEHRVESIFGEDHVGLFFVYRGTGFPKEKAGYYEYLPVADSKRADIEHCLDWADKLTTLELHFDPPCTFVDGACYFDGGTCGGTIQDAHGQTVEFCFDGRSIEGVPDGPERRIPSLAYLSATNPRQKGALPLLIGSQAEWELYEAIESCMEEAFPESVASTIRLRYEQGESNVAHFDNQIESQWSYVQRTLVRLYAGSLWRKARAREYQSVRSNSPLLPTRREGER